MGTKKRNAIYSSKHYLSKTRIALQVVKKPRMLAYKTNYFRTKKIMNISKGAKIYIPMDVEDRGVRSPVNITLLQDVHYRLFIDMPKEKYEELKRRLINHETVFPVYLGHANMRAYFNYIGEIEIKENNDNEVELLSLSRAEQIKNLQQGEFTIIMSVPFDYDYIEKNDRIELSQLANVVYHIEPIKVKLAIAPQESYKIVKSPIEEQLNKSLVFI